MTGLSRFVSIAAVALVAAGATACSDDGNKIERATGPSGDRSRGDVRAGLGGRTQEQGSLFGPGGLFGSKSEKKDDLGGGSGVAVNAYLWRASLDTINFIPLVSADPFGGVIISEWYVAPASPDERLKVTVYIMDRTLRADGLKVVVFRQIRNGATWAEAQPSPDMAHKLEDSILTRARELRLASVTAN